MLEINLNSWKMYMYRAHMYMHSYTLVGYSTNITKRLSMRVCNNFLREFRGNHTEETVKVNINHTIYSYLSANNFGRITGAQQFINI